VKAENPKASGFALPLPGWVLSPYTAIVIAAVHVYLSIEHFSNLVRNPVQFTDLWKGFGSLGGAYVFASLATRGSARHENRLHSLEPAQEG
jgi:hypothetical protein